MDRIDLTKEKFNTLFKAMPCENEGSDPEFMKILQRFIFGEVCYAGSLDDKIRELITITVLTVNQTLPQLEAHVGACLNIGVDPIEIREAIYQCAPVIGFPKTLNAIGIMNEAFKESGIAMPLKEGKTVTEENRYLTGLDLQNPLYGNEIAERYVWLPDDFAKAVPAFLTELQFGDFASRAGLDSKTRELLIISALAALGGSEMQVKAHFNGALKAGNSKEEIVCALVQAMPYMGIPRLFNALNSIREYFN